MGAFTSRAGLYKPGGGSTGLILPDETVDIDKLNGNFDKIDALLGARNIPSASSYTGNMDGDLVYAQDTHFLQMYSSAESKLITPFANSRGAIPVATVGERDLAVPSPRQGNRVFRIDLGTTQTYYEVYEATTNPSGRTSAGWEVDGIVLSKGFALHKNYGADIVLASGSVVHPDPPALLVLGDDGFIDLRLAIRRTTWTSVATVATIPDWARPGGTETFISGQHSGTPSNVFCQISTSGVINIHTAVGGNQVVTFNHRYPTAAAQAALLR